MGTIPNSYTVLPDASVDVQRNVKNAQYGDGYEQRALDGINNIQKTWTVTFTQGTEANMNALVNILENDMGFQTTLWAAPDEGGVHTRWIVRSYSKRMLEGKIVEVSATFRRTYQ